MGKLGVTPGGGGADLDVITATAADVVAPKVIVDKEGEPLPGTMVDRGNWGTTDLAAGASVTIPAGKHGGSGKVVAKSLASQTGGATADDGKVLNNYTYWRDGDLKTGKMVVSSIINFKVAQYSNLTLIGTWALPSRGPWSGVRIMCKQGGYPASPSDGTLFYEGGGTTALKSLAAGDWYFRAWNYMTTNYGRIYGGYVEYYASNVQIRGQQTFTSSGTFVVPANVYAVDVFLVGAGGGGQKGSGSGGGGGGYTLTVKSISVSPGQSIAAIVGAGSIYDGGSSSFGGYVASGGKEATSRGDGGDGGSGGGAGAVTLAGSDHTGGSDGSDAGACGGYQGVGQHSTTRAFGESWNTLYSGGGGGVDGVGGAGGGANSTNHYYNAPSAAANTGGGGGANREPYGNAYGSGGSGIVLVRWGY